MQARRHHIIERLNGQRELDCSKQVEKQIRFVACRFSVSSPHYLGHIGIENLNSSTFIYIMSTITWEDFDKVDIRLGTILTAEPFPNARKPAYQLTIDFGPLGIKRSSAQITTFNSLESLPGKQVIAVVNFPVKQIANFFSECLVLGVYTADRDVILLHPQMQGDNGARIG